MSVAQNKSGLYLCEGCGIGEAIDVGALEALARSEFKIAHCVRQPALCTDEAVAAMRQDVDSGSIDRLAVAACSPRVMSDRFRFDAVPLVRASLREHVAWSQAPGTEDTQMLACDQVRMSLAQLARTALPEPAPVADAARALLVVGGGISGLTAAREAAKSGYPVLLVERGEQLGGWAAQWSQRMPHLPPYRTAQPNDIGKLIDAVREDPRIKVMTGAQVAQPAGRRVAST